MNTRDLTTVLPTLLSELVHGSPRPDVGTYMLNRGDGGLLESLEALSAAGASANSNGGGSIAAHVDHVRYGLALLNRWAAGEPAPWKGADWTASWRRPTVTDAELKRMADGGIRGIRFTQYDPSTAATTKRRNKRKAPKVTALSPIT